jgi:hypothetical protein
MHIKFKSENENAFMASMKVIYHIARESEVHTIEGKLVKHCAIGYVTCRVQEETVRKIQLVPL